ncbi:IQ domain-containing protein G [Elysia marginata]|uniref:Dynein regulatory complex protein 9 n=1 Tax=Elysia marginata TaxID=1093978 RepID=A0AAV4FRG6_9GAST|nr:IQ domain-containing protein G [Elysia marginata]
MQQYQDEVKMWQKKVSLEYVAHYNIVLYLKDHINELNEMLVYWQDKYDADHPHLVNAIEEMVESRNRDRKRTAYIRRIIARHEPIVLEDRRLKALAVEKQQRKERQHQACVKLQSLWRATMVRKELGPFGEYMYELKHPEKAAASKEKDKKGGKKKK